MSLQPDYLLNQHTRWERALHGALSRLRQENRPEMTPGERSKIVIDFCQKNPQTSNDIVYCEFCAEEKAEHILNGTDPHAIPDSCRMILNNFGYLPDSQLKGKHRR